MNCYLYNVGFAETVLVISAATSVNAFPRAGHPDPVTVQVDRYRFPSKGMLSSLVRLLVEPPSSLRFIWYVVITEDYLSYCCLLMSLDRALESLDHAKSSQWSVIQFFDRTLGCVRTWSSVSPVAPGARGQLSAYQRNSQGVCFTRARLVPSRPKRWSHKQVFL